MYPYIIILQGILRISALVLIGLTVTGKGSSAAHYLVVKISKGIKKTS